MRSDGRSILEIGSTCKEGHLMTVKTLYSRKRQDGRVETQCRVCIANARRKRLGMPPLSSVVEWEEASKKQAQRQRLSARRTEEHATDSYLDSIDNYTAW